MTLTVANELMKNLANHLTGSTGYLLKKADELYKKGDYEGALMFYTRGNNLQPYVKEFRLGIDKTEAKLGIYKPREKEPDNGRHQESKSVEVDFVKTVTPAEMQQDPNTLPPTLVQKKNTKYPHLSTKEIFLLEKGMAIYNNKEYDLALPYFIKGKHLNPKSKEFEFYTFMCQRKYDKEELRKKELKMNPKKAASIEKPEATPVPEEYKIDPRSDSVQELEDVFSYRHKYILKRADDCYRVGDFQGSYQYCEKGLQLVPRSKVFQKAKEKAHDGILISLGKKSPTGEMAQKFIVVELVKSQQFFAEKDYDQSFEQCESIIQNVREMPLQKIPDKESLIATAFNIMGNCMYEKENYDKALFYHLQDFKVGTDQKANDILGRALSNLGRVYIKKKEYEKAADIWQQYYDIGIDNNSERSWLCHELGQCHLELNQHQQAINQGENSLEAAEAGDLKDRKVSAAVLIGQAALRGGAVDIAKVAFDKALGYATAARDMQAVATIRPVIKELKELDANSKDVDTDANGNEEFNGDF